MNGAFGKEALKGVKNCTGRRPWLGDTEECVEVPRTLQRGASNVYFPINRSAISIPPWSEAAYKTLNAHWSVLKLIPDGALSSVLQGMNLAAGTAFTTEDLVDAVKQRREGEAGTPSGETSLLEPEYQALVRGKVEISSSQDFVCIPAEGIDVDTRKWFDKTMLVTRLREVRALEKFTRLYPPSPDDLPERRQALSKEPPEWLPAVEVVGEGVFMRLEQSRLSDWENRTEVKERAARIDRNYASRFNSMGKAPDKIITPRLLLVHTLAHALINQWSLESGYPTASLKERLYVSPEMCGFLIYTATSDSAGSLGGITAQANNGKLKPALRQAIVRSAWCSADPLCIEAEAAGVDALNLAACHACVLLPETSCENANILLDRGLLIGTPDDPSLGFFAEILEEV